MQRAKTVLALSEPVGKERLHARDDLLSALCCSRPKLLIFLRGIVISLIDPPELIVDGERVEPENATITLHGNTYGLSDLEDQEEDKWEFGEVGILTVETPGGLAPGHHEVDVEQHLKISYVPAGFRGHDRKVPEPAG